MQIKSTLRLNMNNQASTRDLAGVVQTIPQNQFKNGYASAIQLLGTKQNWLTAKANSLNARMNYLMDTIALFQAMGGGWTMK
jgi:outer membrane protein TolC